MKVLLVEDDHGVAALVRKALSEVGFETHFAFTGDAGDERLREESFTVAVLDLMLPGLDGLSLLKAMRARGDDTPVLLLTAKGNTKDRVDGLDAGADDYLVKPFAVAELVARLRALMRRGTMALVFEDLIVNRTQRIAERNGRRIYLSTMEMALLEFLITNPNRPLSKGELLEAVWSDPAGSNPNVVEVYISHLRQKMELKSEPRLIHTLRGRGYMLSACEP